MGAELRDVTSTGHMYNLYGYISDPKTFATIDYITPFKTFVNGNPANIEGPPAAELGIGVNRFVSFLGNIAYTYKKKYSASLSARKDASNVFGLTTNDKWNPLWSSGVGWELSNESFYKLKKFIPYLKLRFSYGYSGNVDVNKTALPIASANTYVITNLPFVRIAQINNSSLRWERIKQVNLGLDFRIKLGGISGSIDYYQKTGTDLYGPSPFDYTAWGVRNNVNRNVANMKGSGLDVIVNLNNIKGSLNWNSIVFFNWNSTRVTKYFGNSTIDLLLGGGQKITPFIGKPLYAITAYEWGGLNASGDPQGYLNGGLSTDYTAIFAEARSKGTSGGNIKYIGPATPPFYGSITNSFDWKRLSFSFNISYSFGYYFTRIPLLYNSLFASGVGHEEFIHRWRKPGDELLTNVPAMVFSDHPQFENRDLFYRNSEINVLKADHVRLRFINVSYSLPIKSSYRIVIYSNIANLGLLWRANRLGLDPDYASSNTSLPPSRQYTFGIKANF